MTSPDVRARWDQLRSRTDSVATAELDRLWADLESVAVDEILGEWRGFAFTTGHPLERTLATSRWHGKRFVSPQSAQPLICLDEQGRRFSDVTSGRGEASLWNVEFRGEVTATMIYDGLPIFDHFKRVDADTLMGVMNGKAELVLADGEHFWFALVRE